MTESSPSDSPVPSPAAEARRIRFDGTGVKNSYANICHVASTREEIVLNFGMTQEWDRSHHEMQVQVTNRIILNPYAAKRLGLLLNAVVQQYEARFGKLDLSAQSASDAAAAKLETTDMRPHVVK